MYKNILEVIFILTIIVLLGIIYNMYISDDDSSIKENLINLSDNNFNNTLGEVFKKHELNLNEYPNVQIKPGDLLFKNNKFLPECCYYYSQYSSDKGCPCITPEQQYYLQRRGLNKDKDSFMQESRDYKNLFFSPGNSFKGKDSFIKNNVYINKVESNRDSNINEINKLLNISTR